MLGLKVASPEYLVCEFVIVLFKEIDRFGVCDVSEFGRNNAVETLDKPLVNKAVEEFHFLGGVFHNIIDYIFEHVFRNFHVVVEIGESHLGLDHPKFRGVARRIGILGAERRTEGIDVAERHCICLAVQLTADGKVCGFSEEVLCEVNGTVVVFRYIVEIECCYAEHLSCAFTVASGNDRGVYIHEITLLKEFVNRICRKRTDTEHSLKQIRAGAIVLRYSGE